MKWIVTENEESLCAGMTVTDIPAKIPASLRILHKNRAYYTLAENIAGMVPFNNQHVLNIVPKYPHIDPIALLLYINNINMPADENQAEQYNVGEGLVRLETLTQMFARALWEIQAQPIKFYRKATKIETPAIKGRVDWLTTARLHHQGKLNLVSTTASVPTVIIPENILIAQAARRVLPFFSQSALEWEVLHRWSSMPVPGKLPASFFERFDRALRQDQFSGAHAYYYHPVVLAQAVLGFRGLVGGIDFADDAIVFNMPSLYEDFVRTAFQRQAHPLRVTCQKGFTPQSFLFMGGTCELIPDIAIYYGADIRILLDVKYKSPDSKDFYQIYSYMKYAGLSEAFIVSPAVKDDETIVSFDGCQIHMIRVDTSNPEQVERKAYDILENVV